MSNSRLKKRTLSQEDLFNFSELFKLMKPRVMSLVIFTCAVGLLTSPNLVSTKDAVIGILLVSIGAAAAGDLPDVIYHTLQYVLPWAEAGILDVDANNDVVKALGKKTFAPGALNMAKKGSKIAAVPVDGWTQMVVYRKDLFEAAGLQPPTNYANITKAIKALSSDNMYGFVAATKTDENFMSQVLEQDLMLQE